MYVIVALEVCTQDIQGPRYLFARREVWERKGADMAFLNSTFGTGWRKMVKV
jgi:hypothetical protein